MVESRGRDGFEENPRQSETILKVSENLNHIEPIKILLRSHTDQRHHGPLLVRSNLFATRNRRTRTSEGYNRHRQNQREKHRRREYAQAHEEEEQHKEEQFEEVEEEQFPQEEEY